ncbi:hypothetical protein O0I10_006720 [Lichtheimia ornata]|uniref:Uncharacterized protein n=1 Tax=Lichtheimia ornata TaxID=688661 RepID=A0AAD7V1L1_9FUNG|nr:uncharacterized protein O0I10_006720 [Lichtheimia ornata]KAJ8657654.1 hypothetical protein O0I10_006720 [Lichtheimia ornata]
MQCRGVSVSHINATRSAFVSVFKVYHQVVGNIASYPLIQDIFKAARRKQEKLPDPSADICEIETLVMRVTSWGKNEELSLTRLQQKTMVLLAVASMWRIRSDIGRLHWQDVCLQERIDAKVSKMGPLSDVTICQVPTAAIYMQQPKDLRMEMDDDHTFFLGYIENNNLDKVH